MSDVVTIKPPQARTPFNWVEEAGSRRAIRFIPGWNDLSVEHSYGIQGMTFEFVIQALTKAVVFTFDTDWVPGPPTKIRTLNPTTVRCANLIVHLRGSERDWDCEYVDGGSCGDIGVFRPEAEELYQQFLIHGEPIVWATLATYL